MSTVIMQEVQLDQIAGQARSFLSLLRVRDPSTGFHSDRVLGSRNRLPGPAPLTTLTHGKRSPRPLSETAVKVGAILHSDLDGIIT